MELRNKEYYVRSSIYNNARDAWLAEQAEKARFKAEVEAWEAQQAESASLVKAEPVLHGEETRVTKNHYR